MAICMQLLLVIVIVSVHRGLVITRYSVADFTVAFIFMYWYHPLVLKYFVIQNPLFFLCFVQQAVLRCIMPPSGGRVAGYALTTCTELSWY